LYNSSGVTNPQVKTWDGKNELGEVVPNGVYTIKIEFEDTAGNSVIDTSKTITVEIVEAIE
jgi:flagellar hook assembly protein FlgD